VALLACPNLDGRANYGQYFVGSGDDYDEVRESNRLHRLAFILGITGYWVYITAVIAVAIGLGIGYEFLSSKCLPFTWLLTAVVSLLCSFTVPSA